MKKISLYAFILFSVLNLFSQEIKPFWPIKEEEPWKNIILSPTDLIYNEYLKKQEPFSSYVIGATEGAPVVAVSDGVILDISYSINFSHLTTYSSKLYSEIVLLLKKKKIPISKKYIGCTICIMISSGHKIYYNGLMAPTKVSLKTGQKVKKGALLGHVGYYYHKLKQPAIRLSYSINGKNGDIKKYLQGSTRADLSTANEEGLINHASTLHTVDELKRCFTIFKESILEGHPGLYDYTNEEELTKIFNKIEKSLTTPLTSDQLYVRLMPVIRALSDHHTYIKRNYLMNSEMLFSPRSYFPLGLTYINGTCYIYNPGSVKEVKAGWQITAINGEPIDLIAEKLEQLCNKGDGLISSWTAYQLQYEVPYIGTGIGPLYILQNNLKPGDPISVDLLTAKGEKLKLILNIKDRPIPRLSPKREYKPYQTKELNSSTAYLALNTMHLNATEITEISQFFKEIDRSGKSNLIIDLRSNGGGWIEGTGFNYSLLARKKFRIYEYIKARKNRPYDLFKYTLNYAPEESINDNYKKIIGREGVFLTKSDSMYELRTHLPHPDAFKGSVYLLTGNGTGSAAVILAALVYRHKRGTIIGAEGSNGFYKMNALKYANIPLGKTGLELHLPLLQPVFQTGKEKNIPRGRGVIPHYQIIPTYKSVVGESDPELELCLELIKKKVK